jgi:hypothetical protein
MDAQASIVDLKIRQLFAPSSVDPASRLVATIAALFAAIVGLCELPTIERKRRVQSWLPKMFDIHVPREITRTFAGVQSYFRLSQATLAC